MIRFLHTSDWQLGMTRHYLDAEAQARFSEARFEAIKTMAAEAAERDCAFVVVAGDVFETNQVDRRTLARAFDALRSFDVPVYLLPGNHDCLDPSSVYTRPSFVRDLPAQVEVLDDTRPRSPCAGVEVVGVPWHSKRPLRDLVAAALDEVEAPPGFRVMVAHGAVDRLDPDRENPAQISMARVDAAAREGQLHYLALGDRHSRTEVAPHCWYAGAPEPTAYREIDPGQALLVELREGEDPRVEAVQIGQWHFHRPEVELSASRGPQVLRDALDAIEDKRRAIVKLALRGSASLGQWAEIESILDAQRDLFAALEQPQRHRDVAILPEDDDFTALELYGWAAEGLELLRARAGSEDPSRAEDARTARDALGLLLRLARDPEAGP